MRRRFSLVLALIGAPAAVGCAGDFDTSRQTPPRGSLGREIYSMVCDRVGAQALREDVTGSSYHSVCHPASDGTYADHVDVTLLAPLEDGALDVNGEPVALADQEKHRAHRIARIEALGRRREELVRALDAIIPDVALPAKDLAAQDPTASCAPSPAGDGRLPKELGDTLGRFTDLYNDRTIPLVTEALARLMDDVRAAPDAQAALTHLGSRDGYRPGAVALGVVRPVLAYPALPDAADALFGALSLDARSLDATTIADPSKPFGTTNRKPVPGVANAALLDLLAASREELRTADPPVAKDPLVVSTLAGSPPRVVLSRPRTNLEIAREMLLLDDDAFASGAPSKYIVRRDRRGVAAVATQGGALPAPFVDKDGDGLADLDAQGRFVTDKGTRAPSPFASVDAPDDGAPRDAVGRALAAKGGPPLYDYVDTSRTYAASLLQTLKPLLDPDATHHHETVVDAAGALEVVLGARDTSPTSSRSYPPDKTALDPKAPVVVRYRGFDPARSPAVDLTYAVGQLVADPGTDEVLALVERLLTEHPEDVARLVGAGLALKNIADKHPEAHIPATSTLWDELLDVFVKISQTPGILEDLVRAFGQDQTVALKDVLAAYFTDKDELTYDRNNLNGPVFDLTSQSVSPMHVPVDRSLPDTGANRSELQRFLQVLHEANGLAACTKDNAVAHVVWKGIALDYPTDFAAKAACVTLTGNLPPSKLPMCGVLRFENVAALLLDVALDRAQFDVRDPCLKSLMASPLTGVVGGADAFLEEVSGINGFSLHPTVNGVSRMVFFDTPHDGLPGDTKNMKTLNFLKDVLDPVPSTWCPVVPFTDTDGKVLPLRQCASFKDTLRGRDNNATFPLEELGFIQAIRPLAAAFDDHQQPLLMVDLFDTLHVHWGSDKQSLDECDPSAGRAQNPRWCSHDGVVTYEPLLAEAMTTDLFPALRAFVPLLSSTKVERCTAFDPKTQACTQSSQVDGVTVLADAVRRMIDPAKSVGLTDRAGNVTAKRNDGTTNPQTTPLYLLLQALSEIDDAFAAWGKAHPEEGDQAGTPARQAAWRQARSQFVDALFGVTGQGAQSSWQNPATPKMLGEIVRSVRAQRLARCPAGANGAPNANCPWARVDLAKNMADVVHSPITSGAVDLVDALRSDPRARVELERLATYLLDPSSPGDARDAALAALVDLFQALEDDTDLTPLYRAGATAVGAPYLDANGAPRRSFAHAAVEALSRIFARAKDAAGNRVCSAEIDPDLALRAVLQNLVTPMTREPGQPTPLEIVLDVVADVNRASPEVVPAGTAPSPKLEAVDYANIALEVSSFCEDKASGLEQVYEVIREATADP